MKKMIISSLFCLVTVYKLMKNSRIIQCSVITLLLAGLISCGQEQTDTELPQELPEELPEETETSEEPYAVVKIENLQTRLRLLNPKFEVKRDEIWRSDPKNIIINYPLSQEHKADTYFGYADADGQILLCEVINLPEAAKQWKGAFFQTGWTTITEIDIRMNGTVRLYTDDKGEKYGTLDVTSLEPVPESILPVNLQPGVYRETYPGSPDDAFYTIVDFIDREKMEIAGLSNGVYTLLGKYKYEMREHAIILTNMNIGYSSELFFRVVNSSKFEVQYLQGETAQKVGYTVMTFEREKPDEVVKIENLQTRLRLLDPKFYVKRDEIWRSDPKDIIIDYPPSQEHKADTYFGYADADGQILLCEVINFPESAKQWKGAFAYTTGWTTITEINVQMSGTIRLYTDDKDEKYGTLELTSLEPVPESSEPVLQPGVYLETYPTPGYTKIDFIDREKVKITEGYSSIHSESYTYKYEIREHVITLTEINGAISEYGLFFHVLNNSKFELETFYTLLGNKTGWPVITFEKENNQHSNK
ncbi:MAG: hypothetical protein LBL57_05380 [Tannerella sp.]|nr:hypothetical protein [Tannerella sp.]